MPLWEKWRLAFNDRKPIYRQVILQFCQAFVRGEIKPGDRIPSIREIASLLEVNTNTIQRVYQEMEREMLINSKRGTGYFFTEDASMIEKIRRNLALESMRRFADEMRALGCADREILDELALFLKRGEQNAKRS
jgi:DNA-binding transcriptional regulator YhcF (GntR family)